HASSVTKSKSRFCEVRCSDAKASKRLMASLNVPAFRTCSQVRVVKLAGTDWSAGSARYVAQQSEAAAVERGTSPGEKGVRKLTAKGSNWGAAGLDKHALAVKLYEQSW